MKTADEISQWVIDNRYPKSEKEKTSDFEMFIYVKDKIKENFISKQSIIGIIDEMIKYYQVIIWEVERQTENKTTEWWDAKMKVEALTELKQKIESLYPSDGGTST